MSFTEVFGGSTIYPSDVSYLALTLDASVELQWPLEATAGSNIVARIIDVTPATSGLTITMPDATQVSVGETVLFNNLGPDSVTVNNAAGDAIVNLGAGEQWQIYLYDNTSVGGLWRNFRYGASTAQAQASTLAGAGLIAQGSTLAQATTVVELSATPYTLSNPDRAKTFVWTGGAGTLNLPSAASVGNNWFVSVRNGGTGEYTIDPAGSETIDGMLTLSLSPADSATLVSTGTSWVTIGLGQQAVFAFDYTVIAVTGGTYTLSGAELNRIAYKFTGTLASNAEIIVPPTVQQYWIDNQTTGAYDLSVKVSGSSLPVTITQGDTGIFYSNGVDLISATTSTPFAGTLPVAQGGTGATSATDALTNLGGTGVGKAVFTAATADDALTALGATTVGEAVFTAADAAAARAAISAAGSGSNSDITALTNSAGILVGAPDGGAKGDGTINATGLFINGDPVGTGSGSVTSVNVSGTGTGMTFTGGPITGAGTITMGGTLQVDNGGTGQTSYTNGQLLIGNSTGNTLTKATLTAGSGISITNGAGSITIAATGGGTGTVTSVDVSGGTTGLTFSGGPVTSSGTITAAGTLAVANGGTGSTTASGARLALGAAASGANTDITSVASTTTINGVTIGYRSVPRVSSSGGTVSTSDIGKCYAATGSMTIPSSTFAAGDALSIYNNSSSSISITQGSGLTLRLGGTTTTGTRTLAARGMATIWFNSATEAVVVGSGVS